MRSFGVVARVTARRRNRTLPAPWRDERGAASHLAALGVAAVAGIALVATTVGLPATPFKATSGESKTRAAAAYGDLPVSFEPNMGQTDGQVKFMARGSGYTMFLTPGEITMSLAKPAALAGGGAAPTTQSAVVRMKFLGANADPELTGGSPLPGKANYLTGDRSTWATNIATFGEVSYSALYPGIDFVMHGTKGSPEYDFVVAPGADVNRIRLGFEGTTSMSVDEKGDLVLNTEDGTLRQSKPKLYQEIGGKRQPVEGSFLLSGDQVGFKVGAYDTSRPLVIDPVLGYSTFLGGGGADVGFGIAVDASGSAYVAGQTTSTNFPTAGSVSCSSTAFPTSSYQCSPPGTDAFVTKLSPDGSSVVYSTYLGGDKNDIAYRIALGDGGEAYVVGVTDSADDPTTTAVEAAFPTTAGAYDSSCGTDGLCNAVGKVGMADAFVTRLNSTGSALLYSTFLGGSNFDQDPHLTAVPGHMGIAVKGTKAYVTAATGSTDFPTTAGAYQSTCGTAAVAGCDGNRADAFFSVLDTASSGSGSLVYSTYLGGTGADLPKAVAVDKDGIAFVAGTTAAYGSPLTNNFPTKSAFQASFQGGESDAFVAAFDISKSGGDSLVYSTYLGGGGFDHAWGVAALNGKAYVTGQTDSGDDPATLAADGPTPYFPTTLGAYDTTYNGRPTASNGDTIFLNGDAFVVKLKKAGDGLDYSTFLGGSDMDIGAAIAVDSLGQAYVTGYTTCENTSPTGPACLGSFPVTPDAPQLLMDGTYIGFERHNTPTDIFLARLLPDGVGLSYGTYLGGNDFDRGFAVAVRDKDADGDAIVPEAYVTGRIASTNYPTTAGAFKTTKPAGKGNRDAAVSKVVG